MEQEPSEGQVKELQAFMETENQKATIQAAISKLTDICFEKCITKPGNKLDSSEANCVANCAGRFLDSSVFVVNRMMVAPHATWRPSASRALARPRCLSHSAELLPWSQCKEPPPWSQPTGSGRSVLRLSQSLLVDAVPLCIHTLSSLRSQAKRQQGQ